jgi:hypothetical protein
MQLQSTIGKYTTVSMFLPKKIKGACYNLITNIRHLDCQHNPGILYKNIEAKRSSPKSHDY